MITATRSQSRRKRRGFALVTVLTLIAISLTALAGAMSWTSSNSRQTMRSTDYSVAVAAAEAATEKVLTKVISDFQSSGEGEVFRNLDHYKALIPTESDFWNGFTFSDGAGASSRTWVQRYKAETYSTLDSQYEGLQGWTSIYRIISNAAMSHQSHEMVAAVAQDVETASVPVFQFAIFYGLDLELHSMTVMDIRGRVHGNRNIYTYPSQTTTFWADATAVGEFIKTRKPGDPAYSSSPPAGATIYKAKKDAKVATLNLPIGTSNTPDAVREVLFIPPTSENVESALGKQRYYNKAELVIIVTNNAVTAFAKAPFSPTIHPIAASDLSTLIATNASFTDQREGKVMKVTELDVSKIQAWSLGNSSVQQAIGSSKPVNLIYVADNRTLPSSQRAAVRLIHGQTLPTRGLTVATPNPMYVKGHFNQPTTSHLGTTNTSNTRPASLVSDALTILSNDWLDSKSTSSYTSRDAASTTVNAAALTGIVETTSGIYSGGAHNLGRFLEDWSGRTFTYNGSMVVLFSSIKATAPFQQPGGYYEPPNRKFAFDLNFLDSTKLPPGTPDVRVIIRNKWATVTPGHTSFDDSLHPL
jgi:type II secretory pathway pseudopilin PulG